MFNSSRSKIRFNRIRQSKLDYIKHLIANKLGLVATASLTFLFGALFTLNITAIYAQPASTPPNGNVNASFNSVAISGMTDLSGTIVNSSGALNFNDAVDMTGTLSISNMIRNPNSTMYGGAVAIIDPQGLDVRGPIQNNTPTSIPGNTLPVSIPDDVEITRNLTVSGSINTTAGASIGTFFTVTRQYSGRDQMSITCPSNSQLVSCTGKRDSTNAVLYPVSMSNSSCIIKPLTLDGGYSVSAMARCFDPTGDQGDIIVTN